MNLILLGSYFEKVDEFSKLNYLIEEQLRTFQQDEARVVVSPVQMLNIEPSVEEAEIVGKSIQMKVFNGDTEDVEDDK